MSTGYRDGPGAARPAGGWLAGLIVMSLLFANLLPALLEPAEFIQDDAYFYLQIGHNIALGHGNTFHGITPTNGYHPLWLWLVTGAAWLADGDKGSLLSLVFALQAIIFLGAAAVFRRLAAQMGLDHWLLGLAVLTAYLLGTAVYGSEAHVSALTLLAGTACLWRSIEGGRPGNWLLTGLVFGLALLARLDNVFVVAAMCLAGLAYALRRGPRVAGVSALAVGVGGAAVVLPYLYANWAEFGHLVPISGAIKSIFPRMQPDLDNLGSMGKLAAPFGLLGIATGLFLDRHPMRRVIWLGLGTGVTLHAAYIVLYTDHYTFWAWYYVPGVIAAALTASFLWGRVLDRLPRPARPRHARNLTFLLAVCVLAAGSARAWIKAYGIDGLGPIDVQVRINAYRWPDEVGRWMGANLPPDSRVFVYDWPGALAYHSGLSILPMDGLINDFQYNDDLVAMGVHEYLCRHGVDYFFGLIEPHEQAITVEVTAPLYRQPVGTLRYAREDMIASVQEMVARPEQALPFGLWEIRCP